MSANRKRNPRAKVGASREEDKEAASREARKIIRFGRVVYELYWDSGGPGAGAESEYLFRWRDKYASRKSYTEPKGPFDDIRTAIRGAELNAVGGAVVYINSTELSSEEIAELLWDMGTMGESFRINDEPWGFNEEGRAVRRAQSEGVDRV